MSFKENIKGLTMLCSNPLLLNKSSMRKYDDLVIPCEQILVTYIWIDGSGVNLRSKDRTIEFIPKTNKDLPIWYYDGSNTQQATPENSDTFLYPQALYHDPFRRGSHLLALCDTYQHDYEPTCSNHRKRCLESCEKGEPEEPWFGFQQDVVLMSGDGQPLGWPAGGFPAPPGPYYCGVGANRVIGRDLMEAFYKCCLYAGVKMFGLNPGLTPAQWYYQFRKATAFRLGRSFLLLRANIFNTLERRALKGLMLQIGPSAGIKSADDLWLSRYLLTRLAEEYGVLASLDPQPVRGWPGCSASCYFSIRDMREDDGILMIEKAIDKLARRHQTHMAEYDAEGGADNQRRLTGGDHVCDYKDFTAGVANRGCSIRIPRQVSFDRQGYFEDTRPASNADPYRVMDIMIKTCVFNE